VLCGEKGLRPLGKSQNQGAGGRDLESEEDPHCWRRADEERRTNGKKLRGGKITFSGGGKEKKKGNGGRKSVTEWKRRDEKDLFRENRLHSYQKKKNSVRE